MAEQEKNWWNDKAIQLPKGLLIPGVSGEAVAVYAHMKSFGPAAAASLKAVAHRLGWTEARTRGYQKELWKKGWITLLREGEDGEPRQWWMAANEMEGPPQELVDRVSKTSTLPKQAYENQQGAEKAAPQKTSPETNKDLQTNKELNNQPKALTGRDLLAKFIDHRKTQPPYKAIPYRVTGRDGGSAKQLLASGITLAEIEAALTNFYQAEARFTGGHSAHSFFGRFNEFVVAATDPKPKLAPWEVERQKRHEHDERQHLANRRRTEEYLKNLRGEAHP